MKSHNKKEWIIGNIMVILLVACSFFGIAQTPKTPKYSSETIKTASKANDSILRSDDFRQIIQDGDDSITSDSNKVYPVVERMPEFPGGDDSLKHFIRKNIRLDWEINNGEGIPGKVIVRFIVTKSGSVAHVEVIRSLDPACDKEAVRVIKMLPNFIPGEQHGRKVAVYYIFAVSFNPDYY